jgi:predicted nucleotide-binding protein
MALSRIYPDDSESVKEWQRVGPVAEKMDEPAYGLRMIVPSVEGLIQVLTDGMSASIRRTAGGLRRVFVGHGSNPIWGRVVNYLEGERGLEVEAFESESRASEHIIDILGGFLDTCDAAVIVMTADDMTADGRMRARQNVIHEIGLFQGRYGFGRVILFQQYGTEDFSNVAGLQSVTFHQRAEQGFYELGRALDKLQRG